jgi:hypothetical protein
VEAATSNLPVTPSNVQQYEILVRLLHRLIQSNREKPNEIWRTLQFLPPVGALNSTTTPGAEGRTGLSAPLSPG